MCKTPEPNKSLHRSQESEIRFRAWLSGAVRQDRLDEVLESGAMRVRER